MSCYHFAVAFRITLWNKLDPISSLMNTQARLEDIKSTDFYKNFRSPKPEQYEDWIQSLTPEDRIQYAHWLEVRYVQDREPRVEITGVNKSFSIHAGLVKLLHGNIQKAPQVLSACGFKENVVEAVIELAYHIHQPFPSIHNVLVDASMTPFPSQTLEEKFEVIKLALAWKFDVVVKLVSLGMDVENVMNVYQHAYIRHKARSNNWPLLLEACKKKEEDTMFCVGVYSAVQAIIEEMDERKNKLFLYNTIEDLVEKLDPSTQKDISLLLVTKGIYSRLVYSFFDQVSIRNKSELRHFAHSVLLRPTARRRVRQLTIAFDPALIQPGDNEASKPKRKSQCANLGKEDILPVTSIISNCKRLTSLVLVAPLFPASRCREIRCLTFNNVAHLDVPLWLVSRTIAGLYVNSDKACPPLSPLTWPSLSTLTTSVDICHPIRYLKRALDFRHLPNLNQLRVSFYACSDKRARICLSSLRCPASTTFALLGFTRENEHVVPFGVADLSGSVWAHPKALILAPQAEVEWLEKVAELWPPTEGYLSSSLLISDGGGTVPPMSELEARVARRVDCVLRNMEELKKLWGYDDLGTEWEPGDEEQKYFKFADN
ncbi:hypothetical protein V5O48_007893 [Marasmius crinis-equi]|uniref:Uncharacterized protein n=1 Tax=Marasmius crinis-equi TaxID=585013 RepID=A0ABR3FFF0_9AGAR